MPDLRSGLLLGWASPRVCVEPVSEIEPFRNWPLFGIFPNIPPKYLDESLLI